MNASWISESRMRRRVSHGHLCQAWRKMVKQIQIWLSCAVLQKMERYRRYFEPISTWLQVEQILHLWHEWFMTAVAVVFYNDWLLTYSLNYISNESSTSKFFLKCNLEMYCERQQRLCYLQSLIHSTLRLLREWHSLSSGDTVIKSWRSRAIFLASYFKPRST